MSRLVMQRIADANLRRRAKSGPNVASSLVNVLSTSSSSSFSSSSDHEQVPPPPGMESISVQNGSKYWSSDTKTGKAQRPIFVAATKQHVGKTTVSLAIMSGLKKRFDKVGFLKPVGQQHVPVKDSNNETLRVDKDVVLVREHFQLNHIDYRHMSPVIIPAGYTKQFVDGEISFESQLQDVENAMEHVSQRSDITLVEGTGHCAVGSIVGLNNAKVASIIGADMVLM
jgi:hypothetical protein